MPTRRPANAFPPKGEGCGICGRTDQFLVWDHDHEAEEFRGWLCHSCNAGLGRFGDNVEGLLAAVRYLLRDQTVVIARPPK